MSITTARTSTGMTSRIIRIPASFMPKVTLSTPVKVTLIGVGVGCAMLGLMARYMRRRRTPRIPKQTLPSWKGRKITYLKSPNGDLSINRRSASPAPSSEFMCRNSVSLASTQSSASNATSTATLEPSMAPQQPQQLGVMGMEALETAIGYWEDALHAYHPATVNGTLAITNREESEFVHQVEDMLETSYALQERCERLFLHQSSVLFQDDNALSERAGAELDRRTITSISSVDSFVSAQDMIADLREFEEFAEATTDPTQMQLYQSALRLIEEGGIPCRFLRTELFHCPSDADYLAKLHCVRQAFQCIFQAKDRKQWFVDSGRYLITSLLIQADKDTQGFLAAFDDMLSFLNDEVNYPVIIEELYGRGLRSFTFYDVALDFILMDAFDDLENPPSSVTAVVQNRWLSNGFKESALATAVWSVLRTKKRLLKVQNGFVAHFYNISESTSPVLAWGFLGPEEHLRELCYFFKEQIMTFLRGMFDSSRVRYTTVEELSDTIFSFAQERFEFTKQRLNAGT